MKDLPANEVLKVALALDLPRPPMPPASKPPGASEAASEAASVQQESSSSTSASASAHVPIPDDHGCWVGGANDSFENLREEAEIAKSAANNNNNNSSNNDSRNGGGGGGDRGDAGPGGDDGGEAEEDDDSEQLTRHRDHLAFIQERVLSSIPAVSAVEHDRAAEASFATSDQHTVGHSKGASSLRTSVRFEDERVTYDHEGEGAYGDGENGNGEEFFIAGGDDTPSTIASRKSAGTRPSWGSGGST